MWNKGLQNSLRGFFSRQYKLCMLEWYTSSNADDVEEYIKIIKDLWDKTENRYSRELIRNVSMKPIGDIVKIAFIVFNVQCFDKLRPLFEEFQIRTDFNAYLVVVPDIDEEFKHKKTYGPEKKYFESISNKVIFYYNEAGECINLEDYCFDYIYYQVPYDIYFPEAIRSHNVVKYSRICYVPYAFNITSNFDDLLIENKFFFRNVSIFFSPSTTMSNIMIKLFGDGYKDGIQQIKELGYPSLDEYSKLPYSKYVQSITWAPRWTYDKEVGGSHFIEYKDNYINLKNIYNDINLYIRPHPMLFDNMVLTGKMTNDEVEELKIKLKENNIKLLDECPIEYVLEKTDILISDISSIIPSFFMTCRPIIYCRSELNSNSEFEAMLDGIYVADSWEDVEHFISDIINGNDYLKEKRQSLIKSGAFRVHQNSSKKIADFLKNQESHSENSI